jgi:hypothetical protein
MVLQPASTAPEPTTLTSRSRHSTVCRAPRLAGSGYGGRLDGMGDIAAILVVIMRHLGI